MGSKDAVQDNCTLESVNLPKQGCKAMFSLLSGKPGEWGLASPMVGSMFHRAGAMAEKAFFSYNSLTVRVCNIPSLADWVKWADEMG